MIPPDRVVGDVEGLEHEDDEHCGLYRSLQIFRSDFLGWETKK